MPDPIRIVADVPTATPGLGFGEYVSALADVIRGGEPAQFTVGLYGSWGSGKSSLLAGIATELSTDDDVLVVEFDAWRHERSDHVVLPLLYQVMKNASSKAGFHRASVKLASYLKAAMGSITVTAKLGLADIEASGPQLVDRLAADPLPELDAAYAKPLEELKKVPRELRGKRIVILVDDLDRCSPDKVVGVLEAINLVMDIEGFVFVLALDYEVLVNAVSARYPHIASGHAFIEKLVQVPFRVPPLQIPAAAALNQILPGWQSFVLSHDPATVEAIGGIAGLALTGNPRQIKRLVNNVLLLERIVQLRGLDIPLPDIAAVVALQLAWPQEYRSLLDRVALRDTDALQGLGQSDVPNLARFTELYFGGLHDLDVLERTLGLAVTVESSESSKTATERPALEGWLRSMGFVPLTSQRSQEEVAWSSRDVTGLEVTCLRSRIVVAKFIPGEGRRRIAEFRYDDAGQLISAIESALEAGQDWERSFS